VRSLCSSAEQLGADEAGFAKHAEVMRQHRLRELETLHGGFRHRKRPRLGSTTERELCARVRRESCAVQRLECGDDA
jgi:hypothetical protein